jgi:predicted nucleic acid-binding protein
MARIVITDASPLIGLARVDGLEWLRALFGEVWMPVEVRQEVLSGSRSLDEQDILNAERAGFLKVWPSLSPSMPDLPELDEGESACIRIGLGHANSSLLLMDERAGRALAQEKGLSVAGTAAVIGMARSRGLIPSAREVFSRLHDFDFRISQAVIETVLRRVCEIDQGK